MKKSKVFLTVLLLVASINSNALPVFTEGVGVSASLGETVLQDSEDGNLYYFFPNSFNLAKNEEDKVLFTYFEKSNFRSTDAYAIMQYAASISKVVQQKIIEIQKTNPKAKFTLVPAVNVAVDPTKELSPYLIKSSCQTGSGIIDSLISCKWDIRSELRKEFRKVIRGGDQVQVMFVSYSFLAMRLNKEQVQVNQRVVMYTGSVLNDSNFYDSNGNHIVDSVK